MARSRWQQRKRALLIVVALLSAGIGMLAYATHLLRATELQTLDTRFSIRGAEPPPADVTLVLIDNSTLAEMRAHGLASEFPFPRRYDARVIDHLREAGAKVIAMDMQFTQPTDAADDSALAEAIERAHGKIVLASTDVAHNGKTEVIGENPNVIGENELGAKPASAVLHLDSDGVVRRVTHGEHGVESFPVATAEIATHRHLDASLFKGGSLPIDFAGPPGSFPSTSYYDVLTGKFDPGQFAGKVVIVGASAPVLQDVHATATTGSSTMAGPEVWANATATLLRGAPLRDASGAVNLLLIALLGATVPLGSLRVRQWRSLLDALALAVVFTVITQVAFNNGHIITFVYPMLALALGTLGTLAVLYVGETIERARVHDLFSRFVPSEVVDQVIASAGDNLRLGAVERNCTVLFSDLRGFTSFSEKLPATRVIEVVNCYLNEMTEAILDAGGTLISYMGDGIMAVFGAPLEQSDHADRALVAATEMIGARLDAFNSYIASHGHEHRFAMGVGINSGPVMAGNIGSEQRVEYTALGDTTNTASRLEGMTKGSGHMLFIADSTRERMQRPPDSLVLVGELEVRGRVEPVPVWTIAKPE
jgi:adenylate cyclase